MFSTIVPGIFFQKKCSRVFQRFFHNSSKNFSAIFSGVLFGILPRRPFRIWLSITFGLYSSGSQWNSSKISSQNSKFHLYRSFQNSAYDFSWNCFGDFPRFLIHFRRFPHDFFSRKYSWVSFLHPSGKSPGNLRLLRELFLKFFSEFLPSISLFFSLIPPGIIPWIPFTILVEGWFFQKFSKRTSRHSFWNYYIQGMLSFFF